MTKEEYLALPHEDKKLALSSYLDGFQAAIDVVKSIKIRVGDDTTDQTFISNRNTVVSTLQAALKRMKNEI